MRPRISAADRRFEVINILIFVLVAVLGPPLIIFPLHHWIARNLQILDLRTVFPRETIQLAAMLLGAWIVARRSRRTIAQYGLPWKPAIAPKFLEGSVWGFVMLSGVVAALVALGYMHIDGAAMHGATALGYGLAWAVFFTVLGVYEEFFFRGYFLWMAARRMGFWSAAAVMAAAFGVAHLGNDGENVLGIAQVVAFALVASLALRRTGNLWFPIGLHMAWDWAQTYFYGTPDSGLLGVGHFLNSSAAGPSWLAGGSSGPEGSIFSLVVLALAALLIHLRFPRAVYPDYPA